MIVCRPRADYPGKWKISAAFNVSQHDKEPLELFMRTLRCGTIRRAGNDGWYWEVNRIDDLVRTMIPFFERFPIVGKKARDFNLFARAARLLAQRPRTETAIRQVLAFREQMNSGGKRRYSMEGILRDYTPNLPSEG